MYLSSKRSFQQFSYPLLADVFYIWFSFRLFSSICTIIARFTPIFQCIMQHHCTVLSVQNGFFSTMLRQYGLLSRHFSVRTKNASFFGLAYDILVHIQAPCLLIFIQLGELHDRFMIILRSHLVYN